MKALYTALVIGLVLTGCAVYRMHVAAASFAAAEARGDHYCPPDPRECD